MFSNADCLIKYSEEVVRVLPTEQAGEYQSIQSGMSGVGRKRENHERRLVNLENFATPVGRILHFTGGSEQR